MTAPLNTALGGQRQGLSPALTVCLTYEVVSAGHPLVVADDEAGALGQVEGTLTVL